MRRFGFNFLKCGMSCSKSLSRGQKIKRCKLHFLRECFGHGALLVSCCQTGVSGPLEVPEDPKWYLGVGITFRESASRSPASTYSPRTDLSEVTSSPFPPLLSQSHFSTLPNKGRPLSGPRSCFVLHLGQRDNLKYWYWLGESDLILDDEFISNFGGFQIFTLYNIEGDSHLIVSC